MLLIQDSTENLGMSKPLKISGSQANVDVSCDVSRLFVCN